MKKSKLKAGFIQHTNKGSREDNLHYIDQQLAHLAQQGTQLVVLQELHNGAYFCQQEGLACFDLAEAIQGPSLAFWPTVPKPTRW